VLSQFFSGFEGENYFLSMLFSKKIFRQEENFLTGKNWGGAVDTD